MSEKRRDKKKRILRNGESQRKDGRYAYKYYDNAGNVQFVYSWKLEKSDRLPAGKRDDLALREKEREIKQKLEAELIPRGGEVTVLELVNGRTQRQDITLYSTSLKKKNLENARLTVCVFPMLNCG